MIDMVWLDIPSKGQLKFADQKFAPNCKQKNLSLSKAYQRILASLL